jgi:hypothetical protein
MMMRRHQLDPVSLTFGFAFTGVGLLFLLGRADQAIRLRWIWPLLLLALGVAILLDVSRTRPSHDLDAVPDVPPEPEPVPEVDATRDRTEASDAAELDAVEREGPDGDVGGPRGGAEAQAEAEGETEGKRSTGGG